MRSGSTSHSCRRGGKWSTIHCPGSLESVLRGRLHACWPASRDATWPISCWCMGMEEPTTRQPHYQQMCQSKKCHSLLSREPLLLSHLLTDP